MMYFENLTTNLIFIDLYIRLVILNNKLYG